MPSGEEPISLYILIQEAKAVNTWSEGNTFERKYEKRFEVLLKSLSDKDSEQILEMLLLFLDKANRCMDKMGSKVFYLRKLIDWKKRENMIEDLVNKFLELSVKDEDDLPSCGRNTCSDIFEGLVAMLGRIKKLGDYLPQFYQILKNSLAHEKPAALWSCSLEIMGFIPYSNTMAWTHELILKIGEYIKAHPDEVENKDQARLHMFTLMYIFRNFMGGGGKLKINGVIADADKDKSTGKDGPLIEIQQDLLPVWRFAIDQEWRTMNDDMTVSGELLKMMLEDYLNRNTQKTAVLKPFMKGVKELWECGDPILERDAGYIMTAVAGNLELVGDEADTLVDMYLSGEQPSIITKFTQMYRDAPEMFHSRIGEFIQAFRGADSWVVTTTLNLFWEIAKQNPQVFEKDHIKAIVDTLEIKETHSMALMTLQVLAPSRAADIKEYDDNIIAAMEAKPEMSSMGAIILTEIANTDENLGVKYLKILAAMTEQMQPMYQISILLQMKNIGAKNKEILEPYREFFEKKKDDSTLHDMAQACIDMLEGRTLQALSEEVNEQREDIDDLDDRVGATEENVENLSKEVDKTKSDVNDLRDDVNEQGERLGDLEEVVEETVEKVEEIDHKTLSHAPAWSRKVSKLMNPQSDHDWRLLATRLGYTNDDVRNWATQPDPCLSLLDEWFATHKTREATYAVSKILEEMNRLDAAAIVVTALEDANDVVESDDEDDNFEPPPIFISYQWGHQQEVKLLQKHLSMAGYESWMDIGQMGGGDKLYAKIDQGIRAAKIVIACVSDKYAQSPNCNREVNLSVTLGKPMIPLLMEKMAWPPPGTMGPIFSEYLFIRFFARSGEEADDERYWPPPKFQELLMQLRLNIAPKMDLIAEDYKDWWQPPEEVITITKKNTNKAATEVKKTETEEQESSPDVFISYQWGRQPQIQALYQRLTSEGFSCWLDITQMGGGDSLYDKIDKGVRGCKVMLSCITKKYSLSANCRREVSLADAIKKPIIPLRLEDIDWPPAGPMSMVFTQMLYINFAENSEKGPQIWDVPEYEQLLAQIRENVPEIEEDEEDEEEDIDRTKSSPESTPEAQSLENDSNRKKSALSSLNQKLKENEEVFIDSTESLDDNNESEQKQNGSNIHPRSSNGRSTHGVQEPPTKKKSSFCSIL